MKIHVLKFKISTKIKSTWEPTSPKYLPGLFCFKRHCKHAWEICENTNFVGSILIQADPITLPYLTANMQSDWLVDVIKIQNSKVSQRGVYLWKFPVFAMLFKTKQRLENILGKLVPT